MDGNFDPAKFERDVNERIARDGPELVLPIVHGTRNTAVDGIRDISWNLSESETGIEDGNKLAIRRRRYNRIESDGVSVGTNDAVGVGQDLPVLVGVGQSVYFVNCEFGVGGDVRVLGKDLVDSQHSRVRDRGSVGSVEIEGDVRRGDGVLDENAVQDTVSCGSTELVPDFGSRVWAQTNESGEALGFDIHGEGRCVGYQHCIETVRNYMERKETRVVRYAWLLTV